MHKNQTERKIQMKCSQTTYVDNNQKNDLIKWKIKVFNFMR